MKASIHETPSPKRYITFDDDNDVFPLPGRASKSLLRGAVKGLPARERLALNGRRLRLAVVAFA